MENEPLGTLYRSHNEPQIIPVGPDKNWIVIETDGTFQKIQDMDSGLFGLMRNGELLAKTEWFEVTRFPDCWYLRKADVTYSCALDSGILLPALQMNRNKDDVQSDGSIVTYDSLTGMYGYVNKNGIRIFANKYDEILKWELCDVVYTRQGDVIKYFDTNGLQVLSYVRDIPDAIDYRYPYYCDDWHTNDNVIQIMDTTSDPIGDDYCICHGVRAGLSRRTMTEHVSFLQSISNERHLNRKALQALKSAGGDGASFVVQATPNSKHPIYDCFKQLSDRGEFDYPVCEFVFVVVLPQVPTPEQKHETDWLVKCIMDSGGPEKIRKVAYGVNPDIKNGAIVYATRLTWWPEYFPLEFEDETFENLSLSEAKLYVKQRKVNKCVLSLTLDNLIHNYCSDDAPYSWHEKECIGDWLVQSGAHIRKDIITIFDLYAPTETNTIAIIKWLLGPKNARFKIDVNAVYFEKTLLDNVYAWESESESVKRDFIDWLKEHGAKTYIGLRTEESRKFGYDSRVCM